MKRLIPLLLLAFSSAYAGWTQVSTAARESTYVERDTRQKADGTVKMWSLVDHKDFQRLVEVGYFSQKFLIEYDCAGKRARNLAQAFYAEAMGQGKVVYSDETVQDWRALQGADEALWQAACN